MAAPTYMRSLTGTFSAAPHHSPAAASAWAAASARTPSSLSHHHHHPSYTQSINTHNTHIYTHHLQNFNSHHERSYHHHLQPSNTNNAMGLHHHHHHHHQAGMAALRKTGTNSPPGLGSPGSSPMPSASGAGGRRRSSSIRSKNPPPFIKFDPFADEPLLPAAASAPSTGLSAAQSADAAVLNTGRHLDTAAPTEVQRYTSPSASSRRIIASQQTPVHNFGNGAFGPVNGGNRGSAALRYAGPIGSTFSPSPSPSSPTISASTLLSGSGSGSASAPVSRVSSPAPSPPPSRSSTPSPRGPSALGGPNISKLVAGIMLNRVAVGKPMRRRVAPVTTSRQYIKSGLSSVVSCEA